VIETNLFGYVYGAYAALPHLTRSRGVLVNVSSVAGKVGFPYYTAYNTSKFAVTGFSESLREEVKDDGVEVVTVFPASTDTPLFEHAANYTGQEIKPMAPISDAHNVARAIADSIERPQREVFVGPAAKVMTAMRSLVPGMTERMAKRQTETGHFGDRQAPREPGNLFEPERDAPRVTGGWTRGGRKRERGASSRGRGFGTGIVSIAAIAPAAWFAYRYLTGSAGGGRTAPSTRSGGDTALPAEASGV
jgi:hypothetical protein